MPGGQTNHFLQKGGNIVLFARPLKTLGWIQGIQVLRNKRLSSVLLCSGRGNWKNVSADLEHTAPADIVCRREVIDRSQYNVHLILAYLARG